MNTEYKRDFIRAGSIAGQVRAFGKALIVPGASYNQVIAQICARIKELGAIPAFPPQIALNDVAAHFLPRPDADITFSTQVVKLDVGVCYNGAIGDCAVTVDLSGRYQNLIDAAEAALLCAEQTIQVGLSIRELGAAIESKIASFGLRPIRNLCGHGLGKYKIHTVPLIPNCKNQSEGVFRTGMTFAIEPFATNGKGLIHELGKPMIFSLAKTRPIRSESAKKLLKVIYSFNNLPFSLHNVLIAGIPLAETEEIVHELIELGILVGYPPLVEEERGMVAQAENSFLIDEDGKVHVTTKT